MVQTSASQDPSTKPSWWTAEHDAGWQRDRSALQKSWSSRQGRTGEDDFSAVEPALRFGHAARKQFGLDGKALWADVEARLQADWERLNTGRPWSTARPEVLHGWDSHTHIAHDGSGNPATRSGAAGLGGSPAGDSGSGTGTGDY